MSKRSFISKSLRPDVPGTVFHKDTSIELLNGIAMNDILDTRRRRIIIKEILSSDVNKLGDAFKKYKKALEIMFPSIKN